MLGSVFSFHQTIFDEVLSPVCKTLEEVEDLEYHR
jgi:hypothetical protein